MKRYDENGTDFKLNGPRNEASRGSQFASSQNASAAECGMAVAGNVTNSRLQIIQFKIPPKTLELLKQKTGMHILYPPNANFTGRDTLLADLRAALLLRDEEAMTHVEALTGLGGIGKTQLALEYSYRYQNDYDIVWWLRSEMPSTLLDDYALMTTSLKLPGWDTGDLNLMARAARRFLEIYSRWLLVFDNAQDPQDIKPYLPYGGIGHVIITSRNPIWGNLARILKVSRFERSESVEFLCKRTGQEDRGAARDLAEALGDLPLALEQAGAYMETTAKPMGEYQKAVQERKLKMLSKGRPSDYPETVVLTWNISFEAVQEEYPAAIGFLRLFSYLAPDDIPLAQLIKGSGHLPASVASVLQDEDRRDEALAALWRYSLIDISWEKLKGHKTSEETIGGFTSENHPVEVAAPPRRQISVNRLVQDVTRDNLSLQEQKIWAGIAVKLLNAVFPKNEDKQSWVEQSILLPHALVASRHAKNLGVDQDITAYLFTRAGQHLQTRGEFVEAESAFRKALEITKVDVLNHGNAAEANILNNLGTVLHSQENFKEAKEHFKEALKIVEKIHGPEHPTIAAINNNLASVLQCQDDLQGAREHYQIALKIDEIVHGPNHPDVAVDVNNLGLVLMNQHDYEGAKKYFERALRIGREVLGQRHPVVSNYLFNLGWVMHDQGRLRAAQRCYEKALKINREYYGTGHDHPSIAQFLFNLGKVLYAQGDRVEGRKLIEEALPISMKFYGPDHRLTKGVIEFLRDRS